VTSIDQDRVLVLGAGPAGLAAARELAGQGIGVVLAERAEKPGGLAGRLACKATDRCARCGVCLVEDLLASVLASPLVEFRAGCRLASLTETPKGLEAVLIAGERSEAERMAGLIVAVGAEPTRPRPRSHYAYGLWPNIITGLELEEMVRAEETIQRPSDGKWPNRLAFIQCVGSRDRQGEQPGCSQICCAYALRLADWIKSRRPETEVSIFYMDLQTVDRRPQGLLDDLAGRVKFIRALPGQVWPGDDDSLVLDFASPQSPTLQHCQVDLLVLSVGLAASPGSAELAGLLGLERDQDGCLISSQNRPLLVAGAATGPMGVAEAIRQGRLAGRQAAQWAGRDAGR